MDPLSTLSLAGNVIQFVDFGSKLISQGYELYKSSNGQLAVDEELELVTSDLRDVILRIQGATVITPLHPSTSAMIDSSSSYSTPFARICVEAVEVAQVILNKLDGFKIDSNIKSSKSRKLETFHQILKRLWSKNELDQLQERLKTLKDEIDRAVLVAMLQKTNDHHVRMSALFDRLDQQTQLILTALIQSERRISQDHRRDVRTTIAQLMSRHEIFAMDEHCRTRDLNASGRKKDPASLPAFTARVDMLDVSKSDEDRTRELVQNSILESLKYAAMSNRYESLPEAHPQTFEWAFYDSNDDNVSWENLATWLKTGTGIYWIGGKPGSGKSTLMKHLYDDERTHRYLHQWARTGGTKDTPLKLATFFFWNSGSLEQRSQSGMLRSLLFQILSQQPDLIPIALPEVWAIQYTKALYDQQDLLKWHEPWGLRGLLTAFKDVLAQSMVAIKLCLLIDGLDEFDGDHEALADLFNEVAGSSKINSSIKICLSSRPWNIYRENFGHGPSLQLHSLTYRDIEKYVIDRFDANEPFQRLAKGDFQTATKLQREIIAKAEGVFIWVYIVVRDILKSVRNRDSIPELWKRVQALPRDIEPLYDHIMSQIDPFYLPWSSRIFRIVRARLELGSTPRAKGVTGDGFTSGFAVAKDDSGGGCPSIADICLGLDEDLDYKRVGTMSQDQLDSKCKEAEFHIAARCACLLEVHNTNGDSSVSSRSLVQYLHRTARDFIEEPHRWEEVLRYTRADAFDPYLYLMRGHSLALHRFSIEKDKFIDYPPDDQMLDTAIRILIFASYADAHVLSRGEQSKILDATAQTLFKHNIDLSDWPDFSNQHGIPKGLKNPFIGVALSLNLSGYISKKLRKLMFQDRDPKGAKFSATYMLHQIDGSNLIAVEGLPHMSFEMASTLIVLGADINYKSSFGKTTWEWFLERNIPEDSPQFNETKEGLKVDPNLVLLMSLFLSAGADPWVRVSVDSERDSRTITLLDYFENYIRRCYPEYAENLHQVITESMKSFQPPLPQVQNIGQGHSKTKISPGSVARTLNDVLNHTPRILAARANRYSRMFGKVHSLYTSEDKSQNTEESKRKTRRSKFRTEGLVDGDE